MRLSKKAPAAHTREGQTRVQEKFALYVQFAWGKRRQILEWTRENGCAYDKVASGGRYLSIDPVTTDANSGSSFNRYAYANNSPYKYLDPDGRNPLLIAMGVGALVGGSIDIAGQLISTGHVDWGVNGVLGAAAVGAQFGVLGAIGGSISRDSATGQVSNVAVPNAAQAKNIQRFTSKLPANAKDNVKVNPLPNGGVAAQGVSPGNVPGSSALYEKQNDSSGKTVQFTKTTTAPDGTVVHVKDKITGNEVRPNEK